MIEGMRIGLLCTTALMGCVAWAQGSVPLFQHTLANGSYTLLGKAPEQGRSTTIPTLMVPVTLSFGAEKIDAAADVDAVLRSPVFSPFAFASGGTTQYGDALLRSTFPSASGWHTLLGKPEVKAVRITVPIGSGYVLRSRKSGRSLAVVDVEFLQKELFRQLGRQESRLVIAVTHNTTYYALGDATVCCSWGTHGVDSPTQNSFVLASFLKDAPAVVTDRDVQPITQQLAEFINDPLHDPLVDPEHGNHGPGNTFPAWMRPTSMPSGDAGRCGGTSVASTYFLLPATATNPKNNIPAGQAFAAGAWHLENVPLLAWFTGPAEGLGASYSFPDPNALTGPAKQCEPRHRHGSEEPSAEPIPSSGGASAHKLIGYWVGFESAGFAKALRTVSPQWDIIIVAFAAPDHNAPEGTLRFHSPRGLDPNQFKADIAWLKSHGRKVMISLGGGGEVFTMASADSVKSFVTSVANVVSEYGFDGVDIDFETPSLVLDPGDRDFRHPVTPSTVHLIAGLRQLRERFGPGFMISLVPEGPQVPAGYPTYGGQFGSYLPLIEGLRDILSFVDVQDYNTPPLEGLDGEIYQAGSVDYHGALTELLLRGFAVGGDPHHMFAPLPPTKVAVGFLTGDATPREVTQAMEYLIDGRAPAGTTYRLRNPSGYPDLPGVMFWNIDDDRHENYRFSNVVGPLLHGQSRK